MIVVAARPAMGKSTLGPGLLSRSAAIHNNLAAALFCLEMTRDRDRDAPAVGRGADHRSDHMRNGKMGTEEWDQASPVTS